jgi:hypothetical protein
MGKGRPMRKANNLTAICEPIVWKYRGTSTSHNPICLHGLLIGIPLLLQSVLTDKLLYIYYLFVLGQTNR